MNALNRAKREEVLEKCSNIDYHLEQLIAGNYSFNMNMYQTLKNNVAIIRKIIEQCNVKMSDQT